MAIASQRKIYSNHKSGSNAWKARPSTKIDDNSVFSSQDNSTRYCWLWHFLCVICKINGSHFMWKNTTRFRMALLFQLFEYHIFASCICMGLCSLLEFRSFSKNGIIQLLLHLFIYMQHILRVQHILRRSNTLPLLSSVLFRFSFPSTFLFLGERKGK